MSTKFLSPGWRMPRNANQSKSTNYSLDFTFADASYIDFGNNIPTLGYVNSTDTFSISTWVNTAWGSQYVFGNRDSTSGFAFTTYPDAGGASYNGLLLRVGSTDIVATLDRNDLISDSWVHFVWVYDGSGASNSDKIKAYQNGIPLSLTFPFGNFPSTISSNLNFYAGAYTWTGTLVGQYEGGLNELSIFDYALSQSQVTTLWGGGTEVSNPMALPTPPIAYYPLGGSAAAFRTPVNTGDQWLIENNAIGDYVFDFVPGDSIDTNFSLTTGQTQFSASIWVKFTGSLGNDESLIANESGYTADGFAIFKNASNQIVFKCENQSATGTTTIALNKWYLATATYNAGAMVLYVNGQQDATQTTATSITQPSDPKTRLGKYITGNLIPFTGELSNAQIFDTVLSGPEVTTLYNYGSPIQTLANIPQNSNLKAWYKLDATEIYNSSTTEWSVDNNQNPSAYPSSLYFDGNTNYISTATLSSFITNDVSVSAWVNFTTLPSSFDGAFLGMNNSFEEGLNFCSVGGVIRFTIEGYDTNYVANTVTLVAGQWYHFCGTWDGSTIELFTNGASQGTFAYNGSISTSRVLEIGRVYNNGYNIDGKISNVAIWNTGLKSAQVTEIYNNGTPSNLSSHSATSNLVSWYKLNNTTTGIEDSKGSNNGTNNGATEYAGFVNTLAGDSSGMSQSNLTQSDLQTVAPYSKYAMNFDGNDYIDFGNKSSLDITGALSISFWIYGQTNPAHTGIITKTPITSSIPSAAQYHIQYQSSNQLRFLVTGCDLRATTETTGTVPTVDVDSWQHFTMTWNGTNEMIVYKNGVEAATKIQSTTIVSNTNDLLIGRRLGYGYLNGKMSNVSIWNAALSASQVREIYNEGLPSNLNTFSGTAPVSWWQLGENSSFNGNDWIVADEIESNNGESDGMGVDALTNGVGTTANGVSTGMSEGSLVGDAPYSTANAISSGMPVTARGTDVPS